MLKVKDVSDRLDIHPNTVRTWTADFGRHLSDEATPADGLTRYFNEDDLTVMWTIKVLRAENKSTEEINEELDKGYRLEPTGPQEEGEEEPQAPRGREAATMALELVKGQIDSLTNERDYLRQQLEEERAARVDAEKRAALLEGKLEILERQGQQQRPPGGENEKNEPAVG